MSKPKMASKGVYLPESLWTELRDVAATSGHSQAWLIAKGVTDVIKWAKAISEIGSGLSTTPIPGSIQNSAPAPTQGTPTNPLTAVQARLHDGGIWFTLEPLLTAYGVAKPAVIANCIPKDDILNLDSLQWVDAVCLATMQALSKIPDSDKALIQSRLVELSSALAP